jgi:hypothetical protein
LWRSKDRLRKINIVVTDDISLRQNVKIHPLRKDQISDIKTNPLSPKKKPNAEISAEQSLFGDFLMQNPNLEYGVMQYD